ncbi:MAG TPA: cation diffusion facilitator family transporter [Phycisphaerae bacterium]|nr:cation transporter [Phycisphaerales bacterium]HRX86395.1 cation diffusion facilitator family transporter [Phycisphaerae bacterium]
MATGSKKVIYAALLGNGGIAVTKFVAATLTGSSAILAEAIHSVVDTGNQALLLWGLRQARQPADAQFPFGHGKEVYFWSFVVAIVIFAVGAGVSLYEGIKHLIHPHPMEDIFINYVVLGIAFCFEGYTCVIAFREFRAAKGKRGYIQAVRQGKDPTMFIVLFEDSAALLGLLVAFCGILLGQLTGNAHFDGAASIVIGLILATVAILLAWETKGLLIGESANVEVQQRIRGIVVAHAGILNLNELITMHMGPENILVNLSVDFEPQLSSDGVEAATADLNREIKEAVPAVRRVFIEAASLATRGST